MKKTISLGLTIILFISTFVACKSTIIESTMSSDTGYKIGIIQYVEHPSLDEIREAMVLELEQLAEEHKIEVTIDYKNAQADMSLIQSICRNFVEDDVDVIVALATPSVQGAAAVTNTIPIIFSAVSDPIAAGLLTDPNHPDRNITGTSDAIDVAQILNLAAELTPDVHSYGIIYNKGEANSVAVVETTKQLLTEHNITFSEKTVGNSGEVQQAVRVLLEDNDAIFVPIDNTVASAMGVLAEEAKKAKKPVYVAADSMVADGGLATVGINYTYLGERTAYMVIQVLEGIPISDIPVEVMEDYAVVVNLETANVIGVDVSKYSN